MCLLSFNSVFVSTSYRIIRMRCFRISLASNIGTSILNTWFSSGGICIVVLRRTRDMSSAVLWLLGFGTLAGPFSILAVR
jgi:hypothetical protein